MGNRALSPIYLLLAAHILSMAGFSTFAALLPELRDEWALSNAQAGVIGGMFFAGYVATVSYWTALTDRVDARKVYLAGSLIATAAGAGFGLLAQGFASAVLFQALLGVGIAATYMPGLRLLSDRSAGPAQSRYIAFYTSFFGIGTALSYALAGAIAPLGGWRMAFALSAVGPLLSGLMVLVLQKRVARADVAGTFPWQLPAIAAAVNLFSVPASILGNEMALRIGRRRWILMVMAGSGTAGIVLAFSAPWHWALVLLVLAVYASLVMAESATLTAGLIAAAPAELRGAAMGLYSLVGFGGGLIGPVIFGAALDAAGATSVAGWALGYAAIGAGCLASSLVVRIGARRQEE